MLCECCGVCVVCVVCVLLLNGLLAAKLQQLWHTSTGDWDTRQKYEENYDQLNPVMKRWLRRVKPYRYGE